MVVGRLLSYLEGNFSGAIYVKLGERKLFRTPLRLPLEVQPQVCWLKLFRHQVVKLRSLLDDRNPRNPTRMPISHPRNMDKYGLIKGLLYNPSSPKKPLLLGGHVAFGAGVPLDSPWFRTEHFSPATSFASTRDSVSKPQRWRKSPSWVLKPKSLSHYLEDHPI